MVGRSNVEVQAAGRPGPRPHYLRRVIAALDRRRLSIVTVITLAISLRLLIQADLFDFFTPLEICIAWLQHFAELLLIAAVMMLAFTLVDEAVEPEAWWRLPLLFAVLCVAAFAMTWGIAAWLIGGPPPLLNIASGALRLSVPAILLVVIAELYGRAQQAGLALRDAESARSRMQRAEAEQKLRMLQAQLEPHFLFNTLANVRRLYQTDPPSGGRAIRSLMRYLRASLPRLRRETARLDDELELVRAYLELFQMRMGRRLSFSIEVGPSLRAAEFPPMLLITLAENAIKHGIDLTRDGGHIVVAARRHGDVLEVRVEDNGIGFAAAPSSGTGTGLVNLQRQLHALYGDAGRLWLDARTPSGVAATIALPWKIVAGPAAAPAVHAVS